MFIIAFGANLFAPLLPAYRVVASLSQAQVTFLLAIYVAGLIPALLIGGPLSDTRGRRAMVRPALILSGIGSLILVMGVTGSFAVLSVGRFVAGLAAGLVMAAGAAWLQELTVGPAYLGARRATIFLSAGFGLGPLASGLVAEFLPWPDLLPYLLHLVLLAIIAPLAWRTGGGGPRPGAVRRKWFPRSVLSRRFLWSVAAWAPWGFGVTTTAFATLTSLVIDQVQWPIAYSGAIAAVTMLTGAFIQPLATRFGSNLVPPAILGLGLVVAGMLASVAVAVTLSPWLVVPAGILLGASYGVMMVSGLREVRAIAPPEDLGAATGIFYSLTYVGFFAPFAIALIGPIIGYSTIFIIGAVIAAASIVPVAKIAAQVDTENQP
ncbi:MFS transporter [Corynebacterium alimapuense]|uniref:MFS transporter n=2 Tax=Corynebacterium alimapuense TaxID=1576874 RepID=A0A3M8K694_9CORY|nr:MFS transporter [Corynebacterium alimapuense]